MKKYYRWNRTKEELLQDAKEKHIDLRTFKHGVRRKVLIRLINRWYAERYTSPDGRTVRREEYPQLFEQMSYYSARCFQMEEKPKIIERVEAMDAEKTKAIMWLLLQYVVNSLDCKRCPKKCEKPTLGRCMLNVLDEMEELNNATGHKTADDGAD